MQAIYFIKSYWIQICFIFGCIVALIKFISSIIEATKCSLRNDILEIYDRCKDKQQITHYQLESIQYSSSLYFKLKGNSFVKDIVSRVSNFELID